MPDRHMRPKTILLTAAGVIIGSVLFWMGEADDAPGLCLIGLLTAFVLIMRGIYFANVIRKGLHIPIVLFVFGAVGLILPIILILDGEIRILSVTTVLGEVLGFVLILFGVILLRRK